MTDLIINSLNNEMNKEKEDNNKITSTTNNDTKLLRNKTQNKFDENNYNPNLYISLSVNKNKSSSLSKTDKIMQEYNKIKENFNKIVSIFNNTKSKTHKNQDKYIKKLSEYNITLLNYLSELSNLLNKILENPKLYTNKNLLNASGDTLPKSRIIFTKNNQKNSENYEKILMIYEKQFNKITERLKKIKSDEYINYLKSSISNINEEISKYEKENVELKKDQIIFENSLKNKYSGKTPQSVENNIKQKLDTCKRIQFEYAKTSKRIENNKEEIQNNTQKIDILNQKCQNLQKMAKDMYDIEKFETVEKIKKKSKEKKDKIKKKIREYEISIHSMKTDINKLLLEFQKNKKKIQILEVEKNILIEKYTKKQNEYELVNNRINDYKNFNINNNNLNKYIDNKSGFNKRAFYINKKNIKKNIKTEETLKDVEISQNNNANPNDPNNKVLMSSGPSKISLTKEKSNFGDLNDIQLLDQTENQQMENEPEEIDNNYKKNLNQNQINKDIININIIGTKNQIKEDKQEKTNNKINDNKNSKTLSKEMILKGLDNQKKRDNPLIYSSRNNQNKGNFDRRNILKLNFSFTSPSKDNRLNRSLNTLPNERNKLTCEIEEDIVVDSNSANNVNINSKDKKFNTNTKIEDIHISQDKTDNINNNNSVEIDKNLVNHEIINNEKESNENKENDINNNKDKRENALNTILYNVDNKTKNDKFMESTNNNNNNVNNDDENINKSFEEEHIFDKKNEKEKENKNGKEKESKNEKEKESKNEGEKEKVKEPTDSVNYDFDDGDNIIDVDYDKI